jgi:hypothetical protein
MTNDEKITKPEVQTRWDLIPADATASHRDSSFGFWAPFVIRHSSFVIRAKP